MVFFSFIYLIRRDMSPVALWRRWGAWLIASGLEKDACGVWCCAYKWLERAPWRDAGVQVDEEACVRNACGGERRSYALGLMPVLRLLLCFCGL